MVPGILTGTNVYTKKLALTENTGMKNNRDVSGMNNVLIQCMIFMKNVLKNVHNTI